MQNSNLGSLAAFLPASAIQGIAKHLGASEGAVSGGIQASLAAVISGLSQRSNDQGFLSQIMQMAKGAPENAVTSALTNGSLDQCNLGVSDRGQSVPLHCVRRQAGVADRRLSAARQGFVRRLLPPCWRLAARRCWAFWAARSATAV